MQSCAGSRLRAQSAVPHEERRVAAVSVGSKQQWSQSKYPCQLSCDSGQAADITSEVKRADQRKKYILPEVQFSEKLFLACFTLLF